MRAPISCGLGDDRGVKSAVAAVQFSQREIRASLTSWLQQVIVLKFKRVLSPSRERQRIQYRDIVNHHEIHCV